MKKITILILTILAFNAGAFNANNLFAEITIYGKVTSSTNQPLERADVWLSTGYEDEYLYPTQCDKDGSYKIILPDNFNQFRLGFSAVNHSQAEFRIVALPNTSYEINAIINPHYFKNIPDTIFVIGDFNDFSWENELIPMNKNKKGIYSAKIRSKNDTLTYQILLKPQRSINGQNALFHKPDASYDYISYVANKTKNHNIIFDINKFLTEYPEPEFTSSSPAINELRQFDKMAQELYNDNESKDNIRAGAEKFNSLFRQAQHKETKINLISMYFYILDYSKNISDDVASLAANSDIINFLFDSIDINSKVWDMQASNYFHACLIEEESVTSSSRLENFLQANKGTNANAELYYTMISYLINEQEDIVTARKYFARMKEELPEHQNISRLIQWLGHYLDDSKAIRVGNIIPDFELADLDNKDEMISMQSLRGRYILIDAWGTWCPPCVADIPYLEASYERFKDKNFIIYSVAKDKAENVVKFRNGEHKMAWLHSILDATVEKLLEIRGYPTKILISPTGEILDVHLGVDMEALGKKLDKTLTKYLD